MIYVQIELIFGGVGEHKEIEQIYFYILWLSAVKPLISVTTWLFIVLYANDDVSGVKYKPPGPAVMAVCVYWWECFTVCYALWVSAWEKQRTKANKDRVNDLPLFYLFPFQRSFSSYNMMPTAEGMTHMMPNHVLRVGQTIHLEQTHDTVSPHPCGDHGDPDLDISLDNLNRLILELDPTFEPIQVDQSSSCTRTSTGTVWPESQLVPFLEVLCALHSVTFHVI